MVRARIASISPRLAASMCQPSISSSGSSCSGCRAPRSAIQVRPGHPRYALPAPHHESCHAYFFIVYRLKADVLLETTRAITTLLEESLQHPDTKIFPLEDVAAVHELVERGADGNVLVRL